MARKNRMEAAPLATARRAVAVAHGADPSAPAKGQAGRSRVVAYMDPEVVAALRDEAFKRAKAAGLGKPDASALVHEATRAWLHSKGLL